MQVYTIISATNRVGSHTEKIASEYQRILKIKNIEAKVLTLIGLDLLNKNSAYSKIETDTLIPSQKFIFIIPEYNGSFPGVLKAMIDISDVKKVWWWKKALLTGVSTGRAGNLRGMDHITGSLHHMNVVVHPNKLPISTVDQVLGKTGSIENESTLQAINQQLDQFIIF
ncbi:MAG: NAD(P)H-dependent oxidoreductase [Chitinophagaceae bacterium]|nr:NAD(P)H-dependent oxidoreductase [Chitinophagaceae bacterium]